MPSPGKRLFLTVRICGVDWRVYKVPGESKLLQGDEGCCEYWKAEIYINKSLSSERLPDVLDHELDHAVGHQAGSSYAINEAVNTGIPQDKLEELIISSWMNAKRAMLRDNQRVLDILYPRKK